MRYRALHNSAFIAAFAIATLAAPILSAAQLSLIPAQDVFLFARVKGTVPLSFQHDGAEPLTQELTYRIYQASSATLAPLGEKAPIPQQSFPAAASLIVALPFTPPDVRAITSFVLKVYSSDTEIGSANFTVVPPKVFSRLKESKDLDLKQIGLYEPAPWLRPLLEESGLQTTDEPPAEVGLCIVHLPNAEAEADWKDRIASQRGPSATSNSTATLFIIGRGVTGAEKLLPTKTVQNDDRRALVVQDWFVPDLNENPLSQLRLLRAIQSLLKPEAERDPLSKTK